jgi:hypothetical protein
MAIVETQRQPIGIEVIQSLNAIITTIRVHMVVAPSTNVARKGVVIEYAINLGCGSNGFSIVRSLNKSSKLPTANTRVVGTPQMVFTNPIMITHVHKTTDRPPMSLTVKRYRSTNVKL